MLGHATRCLRGDVLWDHHGGHGLQRRRERSGEAAAHALVDRTSPGEAVVLFQCALLTAHWREINPEFKNCWIDKSLGCNCFSFPSKSYCLIWESWGKIQLHTEGKTTEEETRQLISPSQLLAPIRDKREWILASFIKARVSQRKEYHLVERGVSLHFPSAGHLFFCCLLFEKFRLPPGSIYTSFMLVCDDFPS